MLGRVRDAEGRRRSPVRRAEAGVSPAEIQRLFDAYVVMQAQQELQLTDDQFPQFLARVRTRFRTFGGAARWSAGACCRNSVVCRRPRASTRGKYARS